METAARIDLFKERIKPAIPFLKYLARDESVIIAGGVFLEGKFGDIDVWGASVPTEKIGDHYFESPILEHYSGNPYRCDLVTKHAVTYKYNGIVIQSCRQEVKNLSEFLRSFDFGICQIGVKVRFPSAEPVIEEFCETMARIAAVKYERLNYGQSASPGISLLRAIKYAQRMPLDLSNLRNEILQILMDLITKGIRDPDEMFNKDLWSENVGGYSKIPEFVSLLRKLQKLNILDAL